MMKKNTFSIAAIILICSTAVFSQSLDQVNWLNIKEAQNLTKSESKPIFIEFTADWCGWCKKMDRTTFMDERVIKSLNQEFYPVKLDFDSKSTFLFNGKKYTAKKLAREFGVQGLPTMAILSKDLNSHTLIVGYQKGKQLKNKLTQEL
ncbi:MAG: thioredoxin family protein [Reichenbachiella sp.]